jgi:hypothetical protein
VGSNPLHVLVHVDAQLSVQFFFFNFIICQTSAVAGLLWKHGKGEQLALKMGFTRAINCSPKTLSNPDKNLFFPRNLKDFHRIAHLVLTVESK